MFSGPSLSGVDPGAPSPTAPFHRRTPPSPGLRTHHRRSTIPMPLSSPDPTEFSSSEDGDATAAAVSSSGDEDRSDFISDVAICSRYSPLLVLTNSVQEDIVTSECSNSAISSASSTILPTTAVLLCQESTAAVVLEEDRTNLVRSESVNSISYPSLDGPSPVSTGVRQGGGASMGEAEQAISTVSPLCSSQPECVKIPVSVPLTMGEDLVSVKGSDVVETNWAAPLHAVAGSGGSQNFIDDGEALNPVVNADDNHRSCHNMAGSVFLPSVHSASDDVLPLLSTLRQCDHLLVGSHKQVGDGTLFDSSFPMLGGSMGRVGDGLVSEEGRVSPVAREALRPQPADGLRQPPWFPVDPVISVEGDDGHHGRPLLSGVDPGAPSPMAPFHRRTPPSPGFRTHHRRSTVPMPLSSPNPAEFSSSEDGYATAAAVSSSEDEDRSDFISDVAISLRYSPLLVLTNSVQEDIVTSECSNSATSSASSTISPTTAVLLCQESIAAVVLEEDRTNLVRSESVNSISYPSLDGPSPVSAGVRQGVVLPSERLNRPYPRDVVEIHRAAPLHAVAGSGGSQSFIDVGEALTPSVIADDAQHLCCDKACSDFMPSFQTASVDVQPLLSTLR
ncbi:hypothetical protein Dimus_036401 [Dionaea muscipula]